MHRLTIFHCNIKLSFFLIMEYPSKLHWKHVEGTNNVFLLWNHYYKSFYFTEPSIPSKNARYSPHRGLRSFFLVISNLCI